MAYGDFKDFPRRTASDKVFHDKDQWGLILVVYYFFIKSPLRLQINLLLLSVLLNLNYFISTISKRIAQVSYYKIWSIIYINLLEITYVMQS